MLLVLFSSNALSQEAKSSPEGVLNRILSEIKTAQNTSPVVNYVDWKKAFNSLSVERKNKISVNSSDEMKSYYQTILKNPIAVMEKQYKARIAKLDPEQKSVYEEQFSSVKKILEEKTKEMNSRIAESTYEVGEANIDGNIAIVSLKRKYLGKTKEEKVRLEKSDGRWLLPAVNSIGGQVNSVNNAK